MRLQGKITLITGGGTGIGQGIAEAFAHEGATVIITGRREDKLRETCDKINVDPPVRYVVGDVANRDDVARMVAWVKAQFGPVNILVNNAGVNVTDRAINRLTPENWDYLMQVNATGTFNMIHAVLPDMRALKDGLIINISSTSGARAGTLGGAAYSASKYAMGAFSKVVNLEEKEYNIRSTLIYPGEVNTPILDHRPNPVSDEHKARILQPEDVAAAALMVACLPPRACVTDLVIKPTIQDFV